MKGWLAPRAGPSTSGLRICMRPMASSRIRLASASRFRALAAVLCLDLDCRSVANRRSIAVEHKFPHAAPTTAAGGAER